MKRLSLHRDSSSDKLFLCKRKLQPDANRGNYSIVFCRRQSNKKE